jgi:hypothetical protein
MRRAVVAAVSIGASLAPTLVGAQSSRTVSMSRQLEDNEPVRVTVEYASGRFSIGSLKDGLLYRMNLSYDEDHFEPIADYSSHRLHLGVDAIKGGISMRGHRDTGSLDLRLARGVPMDLDLKFGAVKADLDLGGLALTSLDLSTGASESTVDVSEPNTQQMARARFEVGAAEFTARRLGNLDAERIEVDAGVGSLTLWLDGDWHRDAHLLIDMGLGSLELRVPDGLGIQLKKDSFLTALDSEGLVKHGDTYESLDFDGASRKVTIDLDAAFGSVKVVWVRLTGKSQED